MTIREAIDTRHSVRKYTEKKIEGDTLIELTAEIERCNHESGLHIQLCLNDSAAFNGLIAKYGSFRNVRNYIALVGKKEDKFEEKCGYYGERIVLRAQQMGFRTCWVAGTYSKGKCKCDIAEDETLLCVIAIGYSEKNGLPRKTKSIEQLSQVDGQMPDWFRKGMEAAQLAPTAMNQQKFLISLNAGTNEVTAKAGKGFYTNLDLGIVKYHFEIGAGTAGWKWSI